MRLSSASVLCLSLALSANASWLVVNNFCRKTLYLSNANQTSWTPPIQNVSTATSWTTKISGEGNQLGISLVEEYYNEDTPRFILGSSVKDGRLWWTVNSLKADPFDGEPFNVTAGSKECGFTKGYNLDVHNCPDGDFVLAFNPCVDNS
ncbi:hypothetical protein M409DRAFT_49679 [Zasmidium cellare ATCC 36951]|uniref:Uncharacterized protein n=1 Tax=Zasmidium cellare ATCC 36951 TaxID=1080233 RepID=A0A6A6D4Z2_ZASCE|nr:uncharacterized protein M409DRAFT_49679 [Zasmidium cellare ATCC 36951]KAF2173199.1 hypothetical protein M409DRAFT_49679 [Zasmidium cellare ATCC 36951]